jgi:cell division protein FtsB
MKNKAILEQQALNRKIYANDTRYEKVFHNMELLGIVDITTNRQHRNGTVVWRLPIKNTYSRKGEFIEVASYEAGYVRVLNTCMSPYYINKPIFRHIAGNYYGKKPKLIPIEIERLEYLISYCLKNMYIKLANERQTLPARNENLEYEVADLNNELCRMNDKIKQLKQDIAVTEANTELFREVHLSAYNKMIKIKEIIGC